MHILHAKNWISAVCMQYGLALFALDEYFSKVNGLIIKRDYQVINYPTTKL
jgi:hypothetical protein